ALSRVAACGRIERPQARPNPSLGLHHLAGRLSDKGRGDQSESADPRTERLHLVLKLLDLMRNDLNQLLRLLELCRDDLEQLVKVLKVLLLQRVQLLELLRNDLQQLSGLLPGLLRRADSERPSAESVRARRAKPLSGEWRETPGVQVPDRRRSEPERCSCE